MDMIIDGIALCADLGCIIEKRPSFKKPKRRTKSSIVNGGNGTKTTFEGYESYSLPFVIVPTDPTKFNQIYALLDGPRTLVCSDDPTNFRRVEFNEEIEYETLALWKYAQIEMFVPDPLRYVLSEADQNITTFPATIINSGTTISKPLLRVYGTGTVSITLNGVTFTILMFDTVYVLFDCLTKKAYYGTNSKTRNMVGPFPTLAIGNNILSITGAVTQVIISKRTSYL